jgi:hypothetical protein
MNEGFTCGGTHGKQIHRLETQLVVFRIEGGGLIHIIV